MTLKGNRAEIPPTDFKLNGSPVRVAATVKNLASLDTDFSITSPALDIAALGAAGEGVEQREVIENVEARGNFRKAGGSPQLDATFQSTGGSLRDIAYRTLDGQASIRNQKLTIERLTLSAFDGSIAGTGSYDMAKPDEPAFSIRGKVDGIDIGALAAHFGAGACAADVGAPTRYLRPRRAGLRVGGDPPGSGRERRARRSRMGYSRASTSPRASSVASLGSRG